LEKKQLTADMQGKSFSQKKLAKTSLKADEIDFFQACRVPAPA
jgi:hypothetical protein